MSKASGSEDEPLVPDDFDDDFFQELGEKIPEVSIIAIRISDNVSVFYRLLRRCARRTRQTMRTMCSACLFVARATRMICAWKRDDPRSYVNR